MVVSGEGFRREKLLKLYVTGIMMKYDGSLKITKLQ